MMKIIILLLVAIGSYGQVVNNSTVIKRYDEMPISSSVWVTSKTFDTFLSDYAISAKTTYKLKFIDSLTVTIPFIIHKLLNPKAVIITSLDNKGYTLAPYKIDTVSKTVKVTFYKRKSGFLTIY